MDLIELEGEYSGEKYDLLKVITTTGGAYGTAKFQVSYLSNDQLEGGTTSPEVITGGLQHIYGGLYGRWQGATTNSNSTWYIEVYDKGIKPTNKSNATIELRR